MNFGRLASLSHSLSTLVCGSRSAARQERHSQLMTSHLHDGLIPQGYRQRARPTLAMTSSRCSVVLPLSLSHDTLAFDIGVWEPLSARQERHLQLMTSIVERRIADACAAHVLRGGQKRYPAAWHCCCFAVWEEGESSDASSHRRNSSANKTFALRI